METVETTYQNFEAVKKASESGRWVPALLPPSANNIREKHNLDSNEIWLFFKFDLSADMEKLKKTCAPINASEINYPRYPGNWWPKTLARDTQNAQNLEMNYQYFICKDNGMIAINTKLGEAFYWRLSS